MAVKKLMIILFSFVILGFLPSPSSSQVLKAGLTSKAISYLPIFLAEKKGYYEAEGIKVEIVNMGRSDLQVSALVAGNLHFSHFSADGIIMFNEKGGKLKVAAGLVNAAPYVLIGSKGYKKIEDLRGAKLGAGSVRGGATTILMHYLNRRGLTPKDYSIVVISGGTPAALSALEAGVVAAGILQPPFSDMAIDQGLNRLGDVVEVLHRYQFNSTHVNPAWAEKNRTAVVKFIKANIRAIRWIYDNPAKAAEFVENEMAIKAPYSRKGIDYFLKNKIFPPDGSFTLDDLRINIDVLTEDGLLTQPTAPEKHVDFSYLAEAQKELGISTHGK